MSELTCLTASQLAQMIRDRAVSSQEVVEAYLAQIAKHNDTLNAICTLNTEQALAKAKEADAATASGESWGVLHGVPITIKDIFETADLRTTAGYVPLKDYVPQQDATAVARLREAGAVVLGKTNVAELGGDYQSVNPIFPRVNNPWNVRYTPGGSSGGSAAAIAAGLSPLDIGNDIAGSVRQPAHFCGIYGLKPTDRRISTAGMIPEVPGMPVCLRQMIVVGCFARSLEDIGLCFSLLAGADSRQPDVPPVPIDQPVNKPLKALKIAWSDRWPEVPVAADIQAVMNKAAGQLTDAGGQVEPWLPKDFDLGEIVDLYFQLAVYINRYAIPADRHNLKKSIPQIFRGATEGSKQLRQFGDFSRALPQMLNPTLKGYFEALTARDKFTAQIDRAIAPWDVWITPVAATAAFTHCPSWSAVDVDGTAYPHCVANGAYAIPFNLSGHPAVVIPIGQTAEGLPIGLQIVGKRWKEIELIAIAQQIDSIAGTFHMPSEFA
ncbi:MAG: amidase [Cyanobacteria bacterium J06560_6]